MHSSSDNVKFTTNSDANDVIEKRSSKYQDGLETSMKGSDFIFDSV